MVTWNDIKQWKSTSLDTVIDDLISKRKKAAECGEGIVDIDTGVVWSGAGADAASGALSKIESKCELLLANLGSMLSATTTMQNDMGMVETLVQEAVSRIDFYGFSVDAGGNVTDPRNTGDSKSPDAIPVPDTSADLDFIDRSEAVSTAQNNINNALKKARECDASYKASLDSIAKGEVKATEKLGATTPGLINLPGPNASTEYVAAWWASLTDAEKEHLIQTQPATIGNLDGIDGTSRDKANRAQLNADIAATQKELDKAKAEYNSDEAESQRKLGNAEKANKVDELQKKLDELNNLHSSIEGENRQLLVYDPATGEKGHEVLHAAVAVGNVDTADHVSTFVPGMTTNVKDNMEGYTGDMENLKNASERKLQETGQGGSVATIVWQGYDAPPGLGDASSTDRAEVGAKDLKSFEEGLHDSRTAVGNAPDLSVLGHSYGSTTASQAMNEVRPGVVNNFMMYGSPGYMGSGAYDFNVPSGHTYAMRYSNDAIIPAGNSLGNDPMNDSNIKHLDPGKAEHSWPNQGISAHSDYLDDGSQAQKNLADVVTNNAH